MWIERSADKAGRKQASLILRSLNVIWIEIERAKDWVW